jgi:hypothetical protein
LLALLLVASSLSAMAQEAGATEGKMIVASDGARVGAVYRVTKEGAAQVIVEGKMVTIPASTLSVSSDGKLTTTLSKAEIRKLR